MHVVELIDSEQVLFKEGVERLPILRSDEPGQSVEREVDRPRQIGEPHEEDRARSRFGTFLRRARNGWAVPQPLRHERRRQDPVSLTSWSNTSMSLPSGRLLDGAGARNLLSRPRGTESIAIRYWKRSLGFLLS